MLRVAICDDEAAEAARIEGFVRTYGDYDIKVYTSAKELARDVEDGTAFDLYLLDIAMPQLDGIELARIVRSYDETSVIIYLTGRDDRSLDAYNVRAAQYLVKPVSFDILRKELNTALAAVKAKNAKTFLIKTREGTEAIPFHRIVYCELSDRSLMCITADGGRLKSVSLRGSFDEAVAPLMFDARFVRPHVAFVVNLDYVRCVQKNNLLMRIGGSLPIAHRAIGEIKERYYKHFFGGER